MCQLLCVPPHVFTVPAVTISGAGPSDHAKLRPKRAVMRCARASAAKRVGATEHIDVSMQPKGARPFRQTCAERTKHAKLAFDHTHVEDRIA
jgi:hypothetical protein